MSEIGESMQREVRINNSLQSMSEWVIRAGEAEQSLNVANARIAALEAALRGIDESAGKWAGMVADQGEANIHALHRDMARAAMAGPTDRNEQAAQLIQAMSRDCAGCWRCQPESHPKPPGLKTRRAGAPEVEPTLAPREAYPATIIVTEVRRGVPTIHPDEIAPRDGAFEGEQG